MWPMPNEYFPLVGQYKPKRKGNISTVNKFPEYTNEHRPFNNSSDVEMEQSFHEQKYYLGFQGFPN
jgi:hypothetical protein